MAGDFFDSAVPGNRLPQELYHRFLRQMMAEKQQA